MSLGPSDNSKILKATIDFILATKGFNEQLFWKMMEVSADHKQANNPTSLIICCFFKEMDIVFFLLSLLRPIEFLIFM